ncbi:crispr-associated protein, ct1972 family, putative [Heliomicrobium modesticaldum Ice1]|uniref:Crispr-associated protein, ct1972 family, putative n=1 Tax=Heliobacterium modesticaldum (strain ATCC 51547 / Ice1) TaxID=498761 RepID=B0TDT8_HELMI|nr:type I-E CRISPR-associated protein Cse1/CasA [Heliomicrobium modesticaldum]ABZ82801.1 crispr-associated protein, ct1972 family, putative [Heliomicrobium modesticaldum Ice1]
MQPAFDLLTEPWVTVRDVKGRICVVHLRDVLAKAHEWSEVIDESPLIQFGLYRFLQALIIDIFPLKGQRGRLELMEEGQFDETKLNAYWEKYGVYFDLFDAERPFLQVPPREQEKVKRKSVAELFHQLPTGTNVIHFHHRLQDEYVLAPDVCARIMTTLSPFTTAGGQGLSPSINGNPPYYVWRKGDNLFETLLLNYWITDQDRGIPAWRDRRPSRGETRSEARLLEGLTWQPRRVTLIPEMGPFQCTYSGRSCQWGVRQMVFEAGFQARVDTWRDPNVAVVNTDKGRSFVRPRWGRQTWRDVGPLALIDGAGKGVQEKNSYERAPILNQASIYLECEQQTTTIEVYGLQTDGNMKYLDWRYEELQLPAGLEQVPNGEEFALQAMNNAEKAAWALRKAVNMCVQIKQKKGKKEQKIWPGEWGQRVEDAYWLSLEAPYLAFLSVLAGTAKEEDPDKHLETLMEAWTKEIRNKASDYFTEATKENVSDAEAMRRQIQAEQYLRRSLRFIGVKSPSKDEDAAKKGR